MKRFVTWLKYEWELYLREVCEMIYRLLSIMLTFWTFALLMAALQYVLQTSAEPLSYCLWGISAIAWVWFLIRTWRKWFEFLKR